MSLINQIRKARQSVINLGCCRLTITRPTDMDALGMSYATTREAIEGACKFVVDWDGINEIDLVPGGTTEPVQFDSELFGEWIQDKPEHWEALIKGVRDAYQAHRAKVEGDAKN